MSIWIREGKLVDARDTRVNIAKLTAGVYILVERGKVNIAWL
jgi:hypothetical protein